MGSLLALSAALEARDPYTRGHSARVTQLALAIAQRLRSAGAVLEAIRVGGPLHDLGKIAIAEEILLKPGPLDPAERDLIRLHPSTGAGLIGDIPSFATAVGCVLHHHERWDGAGYPYGLAGAEIPLEARILAVADAFDAMTSARPYRPALSRRQAVQEVERCAGSQFDPDVADAFASAVAGSELALGLA